MKRSIITKKRVIIFLCILLIIFITTIGISKYIKIRKYKVINIHSLDKSIINQQIKMGDSNGNVNLPNKLTLTTKNGDVSLDVKWELKEKKENEEGVIFVYGPIIPKEYIIGDKLEIPSIKASFEVLKTTVSGLNNLSITINKKPEKTITVTPAFERTVELQLFDDLKKEWVTKKTFTTENNLESKLKIEFSEEWKEKPTTKWRIYIPETGMGTMYTSEEFSINLKPLEMSISNIESKISIPKNYKLTKTININNAYGKEIFLEYLNPVTQIWEIKSKYKTENSSSSKVNISFPENWSEDQMLVWRIRAPKSLQSKEFISSNITLSELSTSITGLPQAVTAYYNEKGEISATINVALGRTVELQKKINNEWKTLSKKTTKNTIQDKITFDFPEGWDQEDISTWRLYLPKCSYGDEYISNEFKLNVMYKTTVSNLKTDITETAGNDITNNITVEPANGREVFLQYWNSTKKTWETKETIKTEDEKTSNITINYPKEWAYKTNTRWRIYIPSYLNNDSYTKEVKITSKPVYQTPDNYLKITENIKFDGGGYDLIKGTMGLKVKKVQSILGIESDRAIVDNEFIKEVKEFQNKNNLKADGIVGLSTWKKMGLAENDWYNLGTYVTSKKTTPLSKREDYIETMIATAKTYLNTEYVIGAAGKPNTGIDCSGLVMQAFYSVGLNPLPVSIVRHSKPGYEYESYYLWNHSKLKHVKYDERERGDLIFYKNEQGRLNHVAIYLGNDEVIEAWPPKVVIAPTINEEHPYIMGVIRPFP